MAFKYATAEQLKRLQSLKDDWNAALYFQQVRDELNLQIARQTDVIKTKNWPNAMRAYQAELGSAPHAFPDVAACELYYQRHPAIAGLLTYSIKYWETDNWRLVTQASGSGVPEKIHTKYITALCSGPGFDGNTDSFNAINKWVQNAGPFVAELNAIRKEIDETAPVKIKEAQSAYEDYYKVLLKQDDDRSVAMSQISAAAAGQALDELVSEIVQNPVKLAGFGIAVIAGLFTLIVLVRTFIKAKN